MGVTCNSVDSSDEEQYYHSNIDVPLEGLLDKHCSSIHVHLQEHTHET